MVLIGIPFRKLHNILHFFTYRIMLISSVSLFGFLYVLSKKLTAIIFTSCLVHARAHAHAQTYRIFIFSVDIFYTLNTECLVLVDFGVETPITASFPSRNGANKCVFPGVTTIVWIGIWRGMSKTGFRLFVYRFN